ncbi:hypothetical protein HD554DRAFT_2174665 [Boletus coccyginus]|nr:hypothetical protein HD554DRAFT_2174665 [Boletus coccyginus]
MKDERRLAVPPATTSRAPSAAAQSRPSDMFSNDDLARPPSATGSLPDASQLAEDPISHPHPEKVQTAANQKNQDNDRRDRHAHAQYDDAKTSAACSGAIVYVELFLFKGVGGNTPKSGLKTVEERRKELDKMRDGARRGSGELSGGQFDCRF